MGSMFLPYCWWCFCTDVGLNVRDINKMMSEPPKPRHPEAPEPGDEVMFVDLSREKLENLYNNDPE